MPGKTPQRFLRQVVANAVQDAEQVLPGKFRGISLAVGGGAVEIAANRDRWHLDYRGCLQLRLEVRVSLLAGREAQSPAVVVNHDLDVIRVFERPGAAVEGRIVEGPFRGGVLPDEPCEFATVLVVA